MLNLNYHESVEVDGDPPGPQLVVGLADQGAALRLPQRLKLQQLCNHCYMQSAVPTLSSSVIIVIFSKPSRASNWKSLQTALS